MEAEQENASELIAEKRGEPAQQRVQSTIEFPYLDLENSEEIATGVHEVGGSGCEWDQLAAHFKQAAQGGGFRLRLICAKTFGLVAYDRGKISLTALGLRIVDPQQQRIARTEAFLSVPLYKAVYDKFRGGALPPNSGLEREMSALGVAPKQADKARQAFQRSAKFAGFFEFGADRLVMPKNGATTTHEIPRQAEGIPTIGTGTGGGGGSVDLDLDPLLIALLQKIPHQGEPWPGDRRLRWFRTFAMNVSQVYDIDDKPIELNIKVATDQEGTT
jgi:hypothetical protein